MCEEYVTLPDSVIETEVPLDSDDRARKDLLLQQYGERIEKLSQQVKLSTLCMDAGFLTTVDVGQYFMTKDIAEFSQFTDAVACREYTPAMTFPVDQKTMKQNVWQTPNSYLCMREDQGKDNGHLLVPVLRKKWYSLSEDSPQGVWDNMAERMLVEFAESDCPIFRTTSPLSRGRLKSKGHGKLSIHYAADLETIETIFRIIVSANQLSLCGATAEICEEYETLHERTGRPVMMGQSSSFTPAKCGPDRITFGL